MYKRKDVKENRRRKECNMTKSEKRSSFPCTTKHDDHADDHLFGSSLFEGFSKEKKLSRSSSSTGKQFYRDQQQHEREETKAHSIWNNFIPKPSNFANSKCSDDHRRCTVRGRQSHDRIQKEENEQQPTLLYSILTGMLHGPDEKRREDNGGRCNKEQGNPFGSFDTVFQWRHGNDRENASTYRDRRISKGSRDEGNPWATVKDIFSKGSKEVEPFRERRRHSFREEASRSHRMAPKSRIRSSSLSERDRYHKSSSAQSLCGLSGSSFRRSGADMSTGYSERGQRFRKSSEVANTSQQDLARRFRLLSFLEK